jgi:hypothetical protein
VGTLDIGTTPFKVGVNRLALAATRLVTSTVKQRRPYHKDEIQSHKGADLIVPFEYAQPMCAGCAIAAASAGN